MNTLKKTIPLILLSLALISVYPENVRGLIVDEAYIQTVSGYEQTLEIALEEAAAIYIEGNSQFLIALQMELILSSTMKKYSDSFGIAVYKRVNPQPQKGLKFFKAERVFFHYLPYQNRIYINLPLSRSAIDNTGSFTLEEPLIMEDFPLIVSMIPLMKGIPSSVIDNKFYLNIKPILMKAGSLKVEIALPGGSRAADTTQMADEIFQLYIDGQKIIEPFFMPEIESGIHRLKISSMLFQEINGTFTIEPAQEKVLQFELQEPKSFLNITVPRGAEIYLDGDKLSQQQINSLSLSEGSHTVIIKIGDYSISKKINIVAGKNYNLSVIFDIIIEED